MIPPTHITAICLTLACYVSPVFSCDPDAIARDPSGPTPIPGPDTPSDPATVGYFLNHLSLNVHNLTKSIEFYTKVLGFRELFTLPATEHMKIAYLGHAQGGRNGTGYQKTEELNREKNNNAGLIEMIELNVPNRHLPASSEKSNTLGHLGIVVPDVKATQARLEAMEDVEILKNTGDPTPSEGKIAMSNGFPPEVWAHISVEERRMIEGLSSQINKEFIYISDPDGNVIEIQPQVAGV